MTDRPARLEAAEGLLGVAMILPAGLEQAIDDHGLQAEHFHLAEHRSIFQAILAMRDRGSEVSEITVGAFVEAEVKAANRPWQQYSVTDARTFVDYLFGAPWVNVGRISSLVEVLRTEHDWAQIEDRTAAAMEAAHSRDRDAFDAAIAQLDTVGARDLEDVVTVEQLGSEFIDWYAADHTGAISTPFAQLDDLLAGGWLPGATTVIAAWSSMGKSVLVDQCAAHVTSPGVGKTACVYTNEMVRETRTARTIARMTGVPFKRIMRKQLDEAQHRQVVQAAGKLPFPIKECAGWSAHDIARHVRRHKWDLWVVDLVTRIPARDTADWDEISGRLTDAAVQTGTHGLLVCQLNQERNKTLIKPPPIMRDLRGTGSWGNDATNVVFLHRDQEELEDATGHPTGVAQILYDGAIRVEKSRNDQPGGFQVTFNPKRMSFEPLSNYRLGAVAA